MTEPLLTPAGDLTDAGAAALAATAEPSEPDRGDAPDIDDTQRIAPEVFDSLAETLLAEVAARRAAAAQAPASATAPPAAPPPAAGQPRQVMMPIPGEVLIAMLDAAVLGQESYMVGTLGVPPGALVAFHLNRAAMLVAGIENPVLRGQIVDMVVGSFPREVDAAYLRLHTTAGGLVMPGPGMRTAGVPPQ